mmetsp:Transcript_17280/g.41480  ORF Transcript_17280/g.41480 Transcript_17280/m.41480 type:complete len:313 (-) Transcript_17280:887-1825(-)
MVEALVVIVLGDVLPLAVQDVARGAKLLVLLAEAVHHDGEGHGGVPVAQVEHFGAIVAVDSLDGVFMYHAQDAPVQRVLIKLTAETGAIGTYRSLNRSSLSHLQFILAQELQLVVNFCQALQGRCIGIDAHVDLEPHILASKERLLVLILAHVTKCVVLLAAHGQTNPHVVEDPDLLGRALAARGIGVISRQRAVGGRAATAPAEVDLGQGHGVPRVVVGGGIGRADGVDDALELLEEVLVLPEQPLNVPEHIIPAEYLLGVHVEGLDELGVGLAVTAEGGQSGLNEVEELTFHSSVVDEVFLGGRLRLGSR